MQRVSPYLPPLIESTLGTTNSGFRFWRSYLAIHLAVIVIATAAFVAAVEGVHIPAPMYAVLSLIVLCGILMNLGAPVVALYLFAQGCRGSSRYFIAAAIETCLWALHSLVALPAFQ